LLARSFSAYVITLLLIFCLLLELLIPRDSILSTSYGCIALFLVFLVSVSVYYKRGFPLYKRWTLRFIKLYLFWLIISLLFIGHFTLGLYTFFTLAVLPLVVYICLFSIQEIKQWHFLFSIIIITGSDACFIRAYSSLILWDKA
jgi:hypothetical protein